MMFAHCGNPPLLDIFFIEVESVMLLKKKVADFQDMISQTLSMFENMTFTLHFLPFTLSCTPAKPMVSKFFVKSLYLASYN